MTLWMLSIVLAASAVEVQPPPFEDVCFGDFDAVPPAARDAEKPYPTPAELKELLGRVANEPFEIVETTKRLNSVASSHQHERQISHVSGVFRLKVAWKPHTTLRLSLLDCQSLQLHFCTAQRGVLLKYCPPAQHSWGAYGTTLDGTTHRPKTLAGWALDGGRYRRSGLGTVEVRHHQGHIVLTRGDIQLLSAPLDGLPQEVYLEGSTLVRGISVYASGGRLDAPETRPLVLEVPKPAQRQWTSDLPQGAALEKRPDGAVELRAEPGAIVARAALKIPGPGLFEYVFELEEPDVGTGIYLAGEDGSSLGRLGFFRDTTTGATTLAFENHELHATERTFDFARAIVPFAGRHQWVKLTAGGGVLKAWTSGDGVRFSQVIWSPVSIRGPITQVGLYCIASPQKRSIRLRSLAVRRLDALSSLAVLPDHWRASVFGSTTAKRTGLAEAESIDAWDRQVIRARPAEVTAEDWRRACTLWTLAENPYFSLGGELIHRLVGAELARGDLADAAVLDAKLRLLDEAALLIHSLDDRSCRPMQRQYEQLGLRLIHSGHSDPLDVVRRAVIQTPIWNFYRQNAWPDRLLRYELLSRVAEHRWPDVDRLLGSLRFWHGPDRLTGRQPPPQGHLAELLDWSRFQLARQGRNSRGQDARAMPPSWRDTLIERLSKEGYNVAAEFQAAVESSAYRAACQIVANSDAAAVEGLLPDAEDPRLLGSLPVIISRAMQREPALRQAMREHFGSLARLRLGKAVAAADATAVEAVALQFCGTEAAAQSHRWLGDRRLSGGRPAAAIGHYRLALRGMPAGEHAPVRARLRLAGAMRGQDVGRQVDTPVEIGTMRFTVEQFELMVRQLLRSRRQPSSTAVGTSDGPPAAYRAARWARFDGSQFKGPAGDDATDWAARRIAAVVTSRQMIVGDPVALTAFDLQTGEQTWSLSRKLKESAAQWPAVPMRPVVAGGQVFARRLTDSGPEMAAFIAVDGTPMWDSRPDDYVASDPLLVGQDLLAVTARRRSEEGTLALALVALDLRSGRVLRNTPLAEFRRGADNDALLLAQATAADGRIVVTADGCVICCDLTGRVQWIRRQLRVPRSPGSLVQRHEPPPIADGLVYATQPGVWSIECLDLQTGLLVWRKAVPEMIAVLGHVQGVLVVETADGFLGLDTRLGEPLWMHRVEKVGSGEWGVGRSVGIVSPHSPLITHHLPDGAEVLYVKATSDGRSAAEPHLSLVRLDPQSGASRETPIQDVPHRKAPTFGPLVVGHGRIWGLFGTAAKPSTREIFELRATDAEPILEKKQQKQ